MLTSMHPRTLGCMQQRKCTEMRMHRHQIRTKTKRRVSIYYNVVVCLPSHTQVHEKVCDGKCMKTRAHTHTCMHRHSSRTGIKRQTLCVHIRTHASTDSDVVCLQTHTHMRACVRAHTHTHTHTHACTRTGRRRGGGGV